MLPKLLETSNINYITYKPAICNSQTKNSLYRDQEKLLRQVDGNKTCIVYKFQ